MIRETVLRLARWMEVRMSDHDSNKGVDGWRQQTNPGNHTDQGLCNTVVLRFIEQCVISMAWHLNNALQAAGLSHIRISVAIYIPQPRHFTDSINSEEVAKLIADSANYHAILLDVLTPILIEVRERKK